MIALARLLVVGFLVLTVVYICLSLYSRAMRRAKLRTWWVEAGRPGDEESYVEKGLAEYDGSLRRKLILGVYVVPLCLMGLILYLTNFY